jgi:hypothetical protein
MGKMSLDQAHEHWFEAMRQNGWTGKATKLARVMFSTVKKNRYAEHTPVWDTLQKDGQDRVDSDEFAALVADLVTKGLRGASPPPLLSPILVTPAEIEAAICSVADTVNPRCVRQEQILRSALVARLPDHLRLRIGSPTSAVHAERTTPSNHYKISGKTDRTMFARYDLGFGALDENKGIVGLVELKSVRSFKAKLPKGMIEDFRKLLDPDLPNSVLRISMTVATNHERESANLAAKRADRFLADLEEQAGPRGRSNLGTRTARVARNGWREVSWSRGVNLLLAWYQPASADAPDSMASIWT